MSAIEKIDKTDFSEIEKKLQDIPDLLLKFQSNTYLWNK